MDVTLWAENHRDDHLAPVYSVVANKNEVDVRIRFYVRIPGLPFSRSTDTSIVLSLDVAEELLEQLQTALRKEAAR